MLKVSRKTEISSLDGTPEKRMFWSIMSDYDLKTGVTELIDNAVDLWTTQGSGRPLAVELTIDQERQFILLRDNAGGVRREDLRLLIVPGGSSNAPDAELIGIFGVGSKRAVVALAEQVAIRTRHSKDRSYQIDIGKDWLESPSWELPAYEIPDIDRGVTIIELTSLKQLVGADDGSNIRTHLGETYSWFLQNGNCQLSVNGVRADAITFENWSFPPDFLPRSADFEVSPDGSGSVRVNVTGGLIRIGIQ